MDERENMAVPVTRGELRQEIAKLDQKLEIWGGALADRISKVEQRLDRLEKRVDGLYVELARHTQAILEALQGRLTAFDEKYADLPGRVARLERKVFAPKRSPRR